MIKKLLLPICAMVIGCNSSSVMDDVALQTNGIRRVAAAKVDGKDMLYVSEMDGTISLNELDGAQRWRNLTDNPALMFQIEAKDIDGDGNDDILGVSGSGAVYAYSSNGKLLWKYTTPVRTRLNQVVTIGEGLDTKIYTGGNNYTIYELNAKGEQLSATKIEGSIAYMASGDFIEDGKDVLFVYTLSHDKFRSRFFGFIDPQTKRVLRDINDMDPDLKVFSSAGHINPVGSFMVNDVTVADVDKDGRDDLLIAGHTNTIATYAMNGEFKNIIELVFPNNESQRYAHTYAEALMPAADNIVMQHGGVMRVYDLEGNEVMKYGEPHKNIIFNDFECVPDQNMLIGAGQLGGDNTLYKFDLTKENWLATEHEFGGLMKEVQTNVNTLFEQALAFEAPEYQFKRDNDFIVLGINPEKIDPRVAQKDNGTVIYLSGGGNFSEDTPRDDLVAKIGKDALKIDQRRKYNNTREEIVEWARKKEQAGEPFEMWVGHGNDPFFIRVETIEQMIAAAPTCCRGLVYAEMADTSDPRVGHFVYEYMPRIAKAIRENKATTKLYFRYKNMFWAADCHEKIWKELFFSGKYKDIIVPSAEDTNNRLQDLNFSGRVGMYMSGAIEDFAMRLVDDNPTSWRPFSPGGQRSISPYLRNAALMSAYGSRSGLLFSIGYLEKPGYSAFLSLITSGLIPEVKPEDILSVGSWMLVDNIDVEYLERVNNGHDLIRYDITDDLPVVSCAGVHWCGVDIPAHDYSRIALGAQYRWLNFMPEMPNGMVPIAESSYSATLKKESVNYVVTDIKSGYADGKKMNGVEFAPILEKSVVSGADKMLMRVSGASWSLFKVGEKHARLLLVDPGYLDPSEREAVISLQNIMPKGAVDILTGENISIESDKISVTVPAGSMRFIDFEYNEAL